jgi:hypothetical protein
LPAIQAARENSRRQACSNNLIQIGLGLHTYNDSLKRFPNAAELIGSNPTTAGGRSYLFKILFFMGYAQELYPLSNWKQAISPNGSGDTPDPLADSNPLIVKLRDLQIREFVCPSNSNKSYDDATNRKIAFTNYKAMGATSMESMKLCVDPSAPPPYGDAKHHPDGGLPPGKNGIRLSNVTDGTSHTFAVAETMDDSKSGWIAGSDAFLVGMPKAEYYQQYRGSFWIPLDYNGNYYDRAGPKIRAARTFLQFDFGPSGKDAGTYPPGVGRTPAYGPSSAHPDIVNHLFFDGSVKEVRTDIDDAAYFFAITRDNNDPGAEYDTL